VTGAGLYPPATPSKSTFPQRPEAPVTVLGVDLSHHNALPNFAQMRGGGVGFVIAKATESTSFADPMYATFRSGAEGAGLIFGAYHFARLGNAAAEAAYFLRVAAPRPGELVALDLEVAVSGVDPVAWSVQWINAVKAATGCAPLIYLNRALANGHNWAPVQALGCGLWEAIYDGSQAPIAVGGWSIVAVKQFSDRASVPGEGGLVDEDVFEGSLDALRRYTIQGVTPPPPPPPVVTPPPPPPPPAPAFDVAAWRAEAGQTSDHILHLQAWFNRNYPAYSHIGPLSRHYGPQTTAVVREFAHRSGIPSADGLNIGPKIALALARAGFRG
jgi:lysozyme